MRGRAACPFGKAEHEAKTALPELADAELRALAARAGKTLSEYLRDLIFVHLYGTEHVVSVYRDYIDRLGQNAAGMRRRAGANSD